MSHGHDLLEHGVTGDWNQASDWSGGSVPDSVDNVLVAASGTYAITITQEHEAARSLTIDSAGATVQMVDSRLDIGRVLAIESGTLTLDDSELKGETLATGSSGSFVAHSGTLSGVTYEGTLDLSGRKSSLEIRHGLTLTGSNGSGAGTINLTGRHASLLYEGTSSLGNAILDIGGGATLYIKGTSQSETLTLTSTTSVDVTGAAAFKGASHSIVNDGAITIAAGGDQLSEVVGLVVAPFRFL